MTDQEAIDELRARLDALEAEVRAIPERVEERFVAERKLSAEIWRQVEILAP